MEIGQKIYWLVGDKKHEGLFMQYVQENNVEIMCYSMNNIKCRLKVYVNKNIINAIK